MGSALLKDFVIKIVGLICLTVLLGCHKKSPAPTTDQISATPEAPSAAPEPASSPNQATPVSVQPSRPLPPPPPSVAARAENYLRQNVAGEVNASLSTELRNFVQLKHQMPDSFSEFAS